MKHILFCGGGSAGHVVPNLALMNELKYSHRISYMGTGGIERELVRGVPFFRVDCPKLVRAFSLSNLKIPFRLRSAEKEAKEILKREKPDLVFSKGGYASYPAVAAAYSLGIPALTHESDLTPGLCTKLIAKKCKYVLTSFPETAKLFPNGIYTGSPIRREALAGDRIRARHKYGFGLSKPVLLVLGGGSGSRALNEAVSERLGELLRDWQILHLCGKGNGNETREGYCRREFENDMGSAYACADLALCRAGSNTVFELLALKKPALFVPLEKNSRGDQLQNALYFQKRGLCGLLRESGLGDLPDALQRTYRDETLRARIGACEIGSGNERILGLIEECSR